MIRCTNAGIEPSYDCYDVCVLATRCKALKAWEREKERGEKKNKVVKEVPSAETKTKCIAQIKVDIEELVKRIKEEYDIKDRWVPCSERLPKPEKKIYWVCTDSGYQCQCRWTNINHFWTDLTTDWHWHIMDVPQYSKVVAWRELPLPYSEETNDEMVCDEVRREDLATKK